MGQVSSVEENSQSSLNNLKQEVWAARSKQYHRNCSCCEVSHLISSTKKIESLFQTIFPSLGQSQCATSSCKTGLVFSRLSCCRKNFKTVF